MDKPEKYTDLMTRFLNDLRDSGRVNMFGAGTYLRPAFGLTRYETDLCLEYWMREVCK